MPTKAKYELKMGMATREAFGKALVELGRSNADIVVLDADLTGQDSQALLEDIRALEGTVRARLVYEN